MASAFRRKASVHANEEIEIVVDVALVDRVVPARPRADPDHEARDAIEEKDIGEEEVA